MKGNCNMIYFLDTNICVYFLNDKFHNIRDKLASLTPDKVKIPSVVAAELYYGAEKSVKHEYNLERYSKFTALFEVVPFEHIASKVYGGIRVSLESRGQPIGGNDMMIAATVLVHNAVLVTNNVREFSRIEGLAVEDWTKID